MYIVTIPPLKLMLNNLSVIIKKGEKYANDKNIDPQVLLNARLFPDMYPLIKQVQIATDMSKGAAARLARIEIPKYADNESSFLELQARIAKTIAFIETVKPEQMEGSESHNIIITINGNDLKFTGQDYLLKWVNPNVYFHLTTAYNILRHNGVDLGKSDFLGPIY